VIPDPEQREVYHKDLLRTLSVMLHPSGGTKPGDMFGAFLEEAELYALFPTEQQVAALFTASSMGIDMREAAIYLVMFKAAQEAHERRFWHLFDRRRNDRKAKLKSMMRVISSGALGGFSKEAAGQFMSGYAKTVDVIARGA
jgi:hypothetical protein